MRVNVAEFLANREAVRNLVFSETFEPPTDDVLLPNPVAGTFVLSGMGDTVRLRGHARTVAEVVCGSCLTRFALPLEIAVDEEFYRARQAAEAGQEELGSADFVTPLEPGDVLNVTEVVRQHLLIALPIAPRCREDCRGLCPRCGADRNTGTCQCEDRTIDRGVTSGDIDPEAARSGSRRGLSGTPDAPVTFDPRLEPLRQVSDTSRTPAARETGRRKRASGE